MVPLRRWLQPGKRTSKGEGRRAPRGGGGFRKRNRYPSLRSRAEVVNGWRFSKNPGRKELRGADEARAEPILLKEPRAPREK